MTVHDGVQGLCTDGAEPRVKLAAMDPQGNLTGWAPQANGIVGVRALAVNVTLGQVAAGGDFTAIAGRLQKRYAAFGPLAP